MSDRHLIEAALSEHSGRPFTIESQQSIGGGCINDAYRIQGNDGPSYFVKANNKSFLPAFASEANALRELAATQTVSVPEVIDAIEGENQSYLILEYIEARSSQSGNWETLGHQLAQLHKIEQPHFGWQENNLIGATPQPNPRSQAWPEFFRERRIQHQLALCARRGYELPHAEQLLEAIPSFFENYTPYPSLLHGDLWSGNVSFSSDGSPFIYDPASYYGDREADIAFTEFFGGFPKKFYQAYHEKLPLDSGYERRKTLYNLYHCLNHLYLFGASYAAQAEQMTRQLLSR
ncbi:fructosamine kinase family protein [Pelagicoccus sp. NFK12]|uniref:Fructosamine kinase family protein n=1 Tax=Pelagicoccus enzymogenes TaxID=2773457 RepID=A0A927F6L4_9BACT|nr:fructosamine kinase family protein [Pelagicoccus enzymogenes]MBD5778945.1 fructosamine kinase family protein [Pelagicoccus enzymogenes]